MSAGPAQISSLLSNRSLDGLRRMRLNPNGHFTNRVKGGHLARKGGSSTEFADYRDYVAGDDIRFVDWNSFARLQRPYMKLYHEEEDMCLHLMVDCSKSMMMEGKLETAKSIAAGLGMIGLNGTERVSASVLGDAGTASSRRLRPARGRASIAKWLKFVEGIQGGGNRPLEEEIETALRHHSGRGIAVILSDFLTFGDLKRALNLVYSSGMEVWGLQILGPSELDPDVAGDLRMVDSELGDVLDVSSAADLLNMYHEYREAYAERVSKLCSQRAGRFLTLPADVDQDNVFSETLRRAGWIRN